GGARGAAPPPHSGDVQRPDTDAPSDASSGETTSAAEPAVRGESAPPSAKPGSGKTYNPLDPLGLGDALEDLLGLDPDDDVPDSDDDRDPDSDDDAEKTPVPAPKPTATETARPPQRQKPATDTGKRTAKKPAEGTEDGGAADRTKKSIEEAARRVGAEVAELDEDAKGLGPGKDESIPAGAVPRFPCPEADPEALAAAQEEQGIPGLPDDPWTLRSTKLTLRGLDYHGIVRVRTGGGELKPVLKFTASSLDIKDLHQSTVSTMGRTMHVAARADSVSTIRDGTVTMYTEELTGDLFGIIPVTFSPETPPPLNIPYAVFTDVTVRQAGQFGGTLTIPGLHNYLTDGEPPS
ncbi:hypothetical protein, partial [Streptomyces sp. NPDC058953]|uniref:hypothetical protein n=1 Tax=Streptomyces sp. NPDC058953 TaxID=3346676 RepID=UPI0036C6D69D